MDAPRRFASGGEGLAVTGTGDIIQMRNGIGQTARILELQIFQTSEVVLTMNGIVITRGSGGSGGVTHTEWEFEVSGAASGLEIFSLPTVDVGSGDWVETVGWNGTTAFVWTPTPETQLVLAESDHLGVALRVVDTISVGWTVFWEEVGVA